MFCAPGLVFSGAECVGSRFHVWRSQTRFRWYKRRRFPFSCCALPESFSEVPRASGPVFMSCATGNFFGGAECVGSCFIFCAHGIIFGGTGGVGSHFLVLRSRTRFRRYRARRVPFSCVVLPESISAVPRSSGPFFMFCAPRLVFGGTEGVGTIFHVLRSRTHFRLYRGRRVPFSCLTLPETVPAVPSVLVPVFIFCAPGFVFGGTEGVGSRFHVLRDQNRFRRYRGCRVPFSCFALPELISAVPWSAGPFFMFFAHGLIFGGTGGDGSVFLVLRSRTRFRLYRGRRVSFSCFALPDSFSAVSGATSPFL
jgi:hypothetical protein